MKAPEHLLAELVAHGAGLPAAAAAASLGADLGAARAALVARGHVLAEDEAGLLHLACAGRHFDPRAFAAARRGALGAELEIWERVASTNDLARAAAAGGAPAGAAWLAEEQTAGRGRQGRAWQCEAHAGLLVSILLRPRLVPEALPSLLPLALALGASEALSQATHLEVRPRWPNDLWLAGGKLGGLLVEARHGAEPYVVAGLGVNVESRSLEAILMPEAVTLEDMAARLPRRETLLAALFAGMERRLEDWTAGRFADLVASWERADTVVGRRVRLETDRCVLEGRAVGVTAAGLLRLDTGAGVPLELAAGEVHFV